MDKHVFKYFKLLPETEKNSSHDNIIIMDDCTQSDHNGILHIFLVMFLCTSIKVFLQKESDLFYSKKCIVILLHLFVH